MQRGLRLDRDLLRVLVGARCARRDRGAHAVLEALAVPYGFLGAGENRVPFYAKLGWHVFDDVVADYTAFTAEGAGLPMTDQGGWMVLPVAEQLEDWPAGPIWLNGQQV